MLQQMRNTSGITPGSGAKASAYDAALSHSRLVGRLRVLLPIAAGVISLCFIGVAVVKAYLPENLRVESARIEDGKIVMEKPAIAGRNSQGIDYSMIADRALQDIANPDHMTLQDVKAAVPINEDVVARVVASTADFDRGANKLNLPSPFDVNLSNGVTAHFNSAKLDIPGGVMESDTPVNITTTGGSIVAQSMKITDKGHTITLIGQVRANLDPVALRNQAATNKAKSNQSETNQGKK
ncbi:MAG: LPS export ABC transporter periplasmic protein LptC [Neorhizobium sp.]|jgi:lipopolysaccharide export system protein LptC|nr:LPS export ABC transporter periplasmic protein LptC [Neorhizobium sp.]